jgi:hypothetical protein
MKQVVTSFLGKELARAGDLGFDSFDSVFFECFHFLDLFHMMTTRVPISCHLWLYL